MDFIRVYMNILMMVTNINVVHRRRLGSFIIFNDVFYILLLWVKNMPVDKNRTTIFFLSSLKIKVRCINSLLILSIEPLNNLMKSSI